jgi:hypothetical protein
VYKATITVTLTFELSEETELETAEQITKEVTGNLSNYLGDLDVEPKSVDVDVIDIESIEEE